MNRRFNIWIEKKKGPNQNLIIVPHFFFRLCVENMMKFKEISEPFSLSLKKLIGEFIYLIPYFL